METLGFIFLGVFIFLLGWVTGNAVEWVLNARERRIVEKKLADYWTEIYREEQENRE